MIKIMNSYDDNASGEIPEIVIYTYSGYVDMVLKLLKDGQSPNTVDPRDNLSLLHIAAMQGDAKMVQLLLDHDKKYRNLDYSIKSIFRPRLAWQYAANNGFNELADRILDAEINKKYITLSGPN